MTGPGFKSCFERIIKCPYFSQSAGKDDWIPRLSGYAAAIAVARSMHQFRSLNFDFGRSRYSFSLLTEQEENRKLTYRALELCKIWVQWAYWYRYSQASQKTLVRLYASPSILTYCAHRISHVLEIGLPYRRALFFQTITLLLSFVVIFMEFAHRVF